MMDKEPKMLHADDLGMPILRAFGLENQHVTKMVLTIRSGHIPELHITREIWDDSGVDEGFKASFDRYELVPKNARTDDKPG